MMHGRGEIIRPVSGKGKGGCHGQPTGVGLNTLPATLAWTEKGRKKRGKRDAE